METSVVLLAIFTLWICSCQAKVNYKVKCSPDMMEVEVVMPDVSSDVYLLGLKDYPDTTCQPQVDGNKATFKLNLTDVFECGIFKIVNKLTGLTVYVQRIVVEDMDLPKEIIQAKCTSTAQQRRRRNVLPAGFQEPDFRELEIQEINETAPVPLLGVGVRQGGQLVTGELNVNPGTPLQMEIFLDKGSAPVYGLLVSYMQVTDTKVQEETIIFNGCSVDPYLFENFNTVDGDFLSAKFRAFKFPESTYVQFKGTVNVCLDKCRGVECSNGQTGYGRRRREVSSIPDGNKVFEVTMSTFIKVAYTDDKLLQKGKLGNSVIQSQPEQVNATSLHSDAMDQHLKLEKEEVREELRYTIIEANDNLASLHSASLFVIVTTLCLIFVQ